MDGMEKAEWETCSCGKPAVVVYETERWGPVGSCIYWPEALTPEEYRALQAAQEDSPPDA
jgi:hypothetical protein